MVAAVKPAPVKMGHKGRRWRLERDYRGMGPHLVTWSKDRAAVSYAPAPLKAGAITRDQAAAGLREARRSIALLRSMYRG
jgi:hypothetical protein